MNAVFAADDHENIHADNLVGKSAMVRELMLNFLRGAAHVVFSTSDQS